LLACFPLWPVGANAQPAVKILIPNTGQFTDVAAQMENGIELNMKERGDIAADKTID
jgi:hypothetical protein